MYGCEMIWGKDNAVKVRAAVEKATGADCPCKQGRTCPILPPVPVLTRIPESTKLVAVGMLAAAAALL